MALAPAQVAVVEADWAAYRAATSSPSRLLDDISAPAAEAATSARQQARDLILAADPGPARRAALETFLKQQVGRVLRQNAARIDVAKPFRSLGLDSLMGLELRNRLEVELSLSLPATLVWNYPTVTSLVAHLATLLGEQPESLVDAPSSVQADVEVEAILRDIEKLPIEEARRLLAAAGIVEPAS
jgi:acyl carrier protein